MVLMISKIIVGLKIWIGIN